MHAAAQQLDHQRRAVQAFGQHSRGRRRREVIRMDHLRAQLAQQGERAGGIGQRLERPWAGHRQAMYRHAIHRFVWRHAGMPAGQDMHVHTTRLQQWRYRAQLTLGAAKQRMIALDDHRDTKCHSCSLLPPIAASAGTSAGVAVGLWFATSASPRRFTRCHKFECRRVTKRYKPITAARLLLSRKVGIYRSLPTRPAWPTRGPEGRRHKKPLATAA